VTCSCDAAGLCIIVDLKEKSYKKKCYHPQYFKGKNYKAIFSTSSILKKQNWQKQLWKKNTKKKKKRRWQFWKKKKQKTNNNKMGKKNMWGKLKLNFQPT